MKYRVYGGDAKLIGTISTSGRVTDASEGISGGIHALQTLLAIWPDGFFVKKDEPRKWLGRWR